MKQLEDRKAALAAELAAAQPAPIRIHPKLSEVYRDRIARLAQALSEADARSATADVLRGLIEEVRLTPKKGRARHRDQR